MAVIITIAGTDRTADVMAGGFSITKVLTSEQDSCSLVIKSGSAPTQGQEIIITDNGVTLFAGIIDQVQKNFDQVPNIYRYTCNCRDYTFVVNKKLVVETYEGKTADWIFRDITAKYCPGFTVDNVNFGAPLIEYIIFDYKAPSECFRALCDYIGWDWYVDSDKDLRFFEPDSLMLPAPTIIADGVLARKFKFEMDLQGLRNRVYVRGGTMLSDPQPVQWKADGVARIWTIPWGPHEISYDGVSGVIGVGEVAKSIGIENIDAEPTKDFLVNYQEKYIRCSTQTSTPVAGTTISMTAKQDIAVITMVEDLESQTAIAAVQGGDGIYEYAIMDDSLISIEAAEAAGMSDLREHANPRVKGSFETEIPGWQPGQIVTINLPDRGVVGDYQVQKITLTPVTPDTWTHKIEYGGRLLGIADFLKALVSSQQKKKTGDTAIISKFNRQQDTAKLSDQTVQILRTPPWYVEDDLAQTLDLASVATVPTFTRASVAYKQDGSQVVTGDPRYEAGKFGKGITIEESTTNLLANTNGRPNAMTAAGTTPPIVSLVTDQNNPFGSECWKIEFLANSTTSYNGCRAITNSWAFTLNLPYSHSVWIKDMSSKITCYPTGGHGLGMLVVTGNQIGNWKEYKIDNAIPAWSGTNYLTFYLNAATNENIVIYVAAGQVEQRAYSTSFVPSSRSEDSLNIPTAGLMNDSGPWTLSCWVKLNNVPSTRNPYIIFAAWSKFYAALHGTLLKPYFSWMDGTQQTKYATNVLTNLTSWHNWVFVFTGVRAKLYVDGVKFLDEVTTLPSAIPSVLNVGRMGSNYHINGIVDDFRVFKTALTDADILTLFNGASFANDIETTFIMGFENSLTPEKPALSAITSAQRPRIKIENASGLKIATRAVGGAWNDKVDVDLIDSQKLVYSGEFVLKASQARQAQVTQKTDAICGFVLVETGIIQNGLLAQYDFLQGADSQVLYDKSGNGRHGTLGSAAGADTNDPAWDTTGLVFAGDDYVLGDVFNALNMQLKTLQLVFYTATSIGPASTNQGLAWLQYDTLSQQVASVILGSSTGYLSNEVITISNAASGIRMGWCDAGGVISAGWHLLDLVWDGAKYRIILDGEEKPVTVVGIPTLIIINKFQLGRIESGSGYFTGKEGYLLMYDSVLNDIDMTQNRRVIKQEMAKRGVSLNVILP